MEPEEAKRRKKAALETLKKHCSQLMKVMVKPEVPDYLFEEDLIKDSTHLLLDKPEAIEGSKRTIYHDVRQAVENDYESFFKLCNVLEKEEVKEDELSRKLKEMYTKKLEEFGPSDNQKSTEQFCKEFQTLMSKMKVYRDDFLKGMVPISLLKDVIKNAIEHALKSSENKESLKAQMHSLCYELCVIPSNGLREWAMQRIKQACGDDTPLPFASLNAPPAVQPLFCKETLYHAVICCDALGKADNFLNTNTSDHLLEEASMSLYQEEIGNTDCCIIARKDNTFYVAFQSEPTLSAWLKSPYQSFDEGLKVQMNNFSLHFLEQLLSEQKKIVLTGFSFGGMLACCVAANLWMDFSVSWDILSSNVICITFGLPLIPMSCIQDIVQYPKFKNFRSIQFFSDLALLESLCTEAVSSQDSSEALTHLKTALIDIIPQAQKDAHQNTLFGNCFIISHSLEDFVWEDFLSENLAFLDLGFLTTHDVKDLGIHSFTEHTMNGYRKGVLRSYMKKDDCYVPSRRASSLTEISEVSILAPNTEEAEFYAYPGIHEVNLNGENLYFCRKICLGDTAAIKVKTPAEDVSPRQIVLYLKASDETKSLISEACTISVKLYSHFAKVLTFTIPVVKEPFTFSLRQIQLAKCPPTEVILLAFMSALLEQFPDCSRATNSVSKRFEVIQKFLEEVVEVVPIESVLWAIASCDDYTAVHCANLLIASEKKIPVNQYGVTVRIAEKAIIRLRTGANTRQIDCIFRACILKNPIPQMYWSLSAPTTEDLTVTAYPIYTSKKIGPLEFSKTFQLGMLNLTLFRDEIHPDIAKRLEDIINTKVTECPEVGYCNLSIEDVYPVKSDKSTFQSPMNVLRDVQERLTLFIQDSLQTTQQNLSSENTQLHNEEMFALVKEIFRNSLSICASLLGAFMEEHIFVPLIISHTHTATTLKENSSPVATGVWALFNVSFDELLKMLSAMDDTHHLLVEIKDYITGVLSDDLKSQDFYRQSSEYNAKLQFLVQVINSKKTITCSSQYISYSLECQLLKNLNANPKFKETYTVNDLVRKWSEIFDEDALSLVAVSHRPLVARWIKWALLIHKLRETLAKYTCVGITGVINSGKSLLVSKLFEVQTMVGTTRRKRTTLPLLYNLDGKVDGLDVIDFPGVDDKDHTLPGLASLLLGLIQAVIFVVDHKRISSEVVKIFLKFLEDKDIPVIVCMTHADFLYNEFVTEEEGQPLEPTLYKQKRFKIDRQEKEKIVKPHPSRSLHYCCFHLPPGYKQELNMENLNKVGIKSATDIGDELVKVFRGKLGQKDLANKLDKFIHTKENQENQQQSLSVPNENKGYAQSAFPRVKKGITSPPGFEEHTQNFQPGDSISYSTQMTSSDMIDSDISLLGPETRMTSDFVVAFGADHGASATSLWKLNEIHSTLRLDGKDITIAVLDTGVYVDHVALQEAWKEKRIQGANFSPQCDWKEKGSHGSMAAFIAAGKGFHPKSSVKPIPSGVAPGATLLICCIGNDTSYGYQPIIKALEKLLALKKKSKSIDVVTMSFGCELDHDSDGQKTIRELIEDLDKEGVVCVAASGNYGNYKDVLFPACLDCVISVGALNRHGYKSQSNTTSRGIDVYAPGEGIASPSIHSKDGVVYHDGSSCATPAVAGLVALLLQYANNYLSEKKRNQYRDSLFLRRDIFAKQMKRGNPDLLEPYDYFMQRPELQHLLKSSSERSDELDEDDPFTT